jgi:hypothetical protein
MHTIKDVIDLLRMNHILDDWTDAQIATGTINAINTCCHTHTTDKHGNLDGVVIGRWVEPTKHIFVIAAVGKGKLRIFFDFLRNHFPECRRISYLRHGVEKIIEF